MSEKRFTIAYGGNVIEDRLEKKAYQTSTFKEDVKSVVDLLNSLWEGNEQLRQTNEKLNKEKQRLIYHINQPPEK